MRGLALALTLLAGCTSGGADREATLRVFAASSLSDVFAELEAAFEAANPGVDVVTSYAGSQVLRLQIEQGAQADVFASADPRHVEALAAEGRVDRREVFAHNRLVVVVPESNPAGIARLVDLRRAERLVIGTEHAPIGAYTRELLRRAAGTLGAGFDEAVLARVVSEESNVRQVRAKVELEEADAAVVYASDAATGRVRAIEIPEPLGVRAAYHMASLHGGEGALAARWRELVRSEEGRAILERHGLEAE